jgi:hypothetical protein
MNMIETKVEASLREAGAGGPFSSLNQSVSKLHALHALTRGSWVQGCTKPMESVQLPYALETRVHSKSLRGPVSVRAPGC